MEATLTNFCSLQYTTKTRGLECVADSSNPSIYIKVSCKNVVKNHVNILQTTQLNCKSLKTPLIHQTDMAWLKFKSNFFTSEVFTWIKSTYKVSYNILEYKS